ncbi:hypothetical protein DL766_005001 [Monosporascus sp. MC13-8B]|nr:hypothetical protein DL763_004071 [Monosporascus cannonballus]RYP30173.1 hypothetical protein DL766_005001 [Monosporascus sp. MC13-8B]
MQHKSIIPVTGGTSSLGVPRNLTHARNGLEATFGISHVGHALLLHLLAPGLAPDGAPTVLASSGTHDPAQKSGLPDGKYDTAASLALPGRQRYATSKLVNLLWPYALTRRLRAQQDEEELR